MQCNNCGHELVPNAEFCGNCGAKLVFPAAPQLPPQPVSPSFSPIPGQFPAPPPAPLPVPQQPHIAQPQGYSQPPITHFGQPPQAYAVARQSSDTFSVVGLVFGVLSLISCLLFFVSIPFGILALIFSLIGISKGGKKLGLIGLAFAGVALIATIVITIILIRYSDNHPEYDSSASTQSQFMAPLHVLRS